MSIENKLDFFAETKHSYGKTALILSGGATFGKYHFGIIKALYEQDLFPRIVCGSSVGSIVATVVCSRPYDELDAVSRKDFDFWIYRIILAMFIHSNLLFHRFSTQNIRSSTLSYRKLLTLACSSWKIFFQARSYLTRRRWKTISIGIPATWLSRRCSKSLAGTWISQSQTFRWPWLRGCLTTSQRLISSFGQLYVRPVLSRSYLPRSIWCKNLTMEQSYSTTHRPNECNSLTVLSPQISRWRVLPSSSTLILSSSRRSTHTFAPLYQLMLAKCSIQISKNASLESQRG